MKEQKSNGGRLGHPRLSGSAATLIPLSCRQLANAGLNCRDFARRGYSASVTAARLLDQARAIQRHTEGASSCVCCYRRNALPTIIPSGHAAAHEHFIGEQISRGPKQSSWLVASRRHWFYSTERSLIIASWL